MTPCITPLAHRVERRPDDWQRWDERRRKKLTEERCQRAEEQARECTFRPELCTGSERMMKKASGAPNCERLHQDAIRRQASKTRGAEKSGPGSAGSSVPSASTSAGTGSSGVSTPPEDAPAALSFSDFLSRAGGGQPAPKAAAAPQRASTPAAAQRPSSAKPPSHPTQVSRSPRVAVASQRPGSAAPARQESPARGRPTPARQESPRRTIPPSRQESPVRQATFHRSSSPRLGAGTATPSNAARAARGKDRSVERLGGAGIGSGVAAAIGAKGLEAVSFSDLAHFASAPPVSEPARPRERLVCSDMMAEILAGEESPRAAPAPFRERPSELYSASSSYLPSKSAGAPSPSAWGSSVSPFAPPPRDAEGSSFSGFTLSAVATPSRASVPSKPSTPTASSASRLKATTDVASSKARTPATMTTRAATTPNRRAPVTPKASAAAPSPSRLGGSHSGSSVAKPGRNSLHDTKPIPSSGSYGASAGRPCSARASPNPRRVTSSRDVQTAKVTPGFEDVLRMTLQGCL